MGAGRGGRTGGGRGRPGGRRARASGRPCGEDGSRDDRGAGRQPEPAVGRPWRNGCGGAGGAAGAARALPSDGAVPVVGAADVDGRAAARPVVEQAVRAVAGEAARGLAGAVGAGGAGGGGAGCGRAAGGAGRRWRPMRRSRCGRAGREAAVVDGGRRAPGADVRAPGRRSAVAAGGGHRVWPTGRPGSPRCCPRSSVRWAARCWRGCAGWRRAVRPRRYGQDAERRLRSAAAGCGPGPGPGAGRRRAAALPRGAGAVRGGVRCLTVAAWRPACERRPGWHRHGARALPPFGPSGSPPAVRALPPSAFPS